MVADAKWVKLPAIKGGAGGCLHCGYQHEQLPMDAIVGVGFGSAGVSRDGETIWDESRDSNGEFDDLLTVQQAEELAAKDPDHDWRIYLVAPLSERHYQRQGDAYWVLYKKGEGFA